MAARSSCLEVAEAVNSAVVGTVAVAGTAAAGIVESTVAVVSRSVEERQSFEGDMKRMVDDRWPVVQACRMDWTEASLCVEAE